MTPNIDDLLAARISEDQLMAIHTRYELTGFDDVEDVLVFILSTLHTVPRLSFESCIKKCNVGPQGFSTNYCSAQGAERK